MTTGRTAPRVLSYPPRHDYVDRLDPDAAVLVHRDEPWPRLERLYDPEWLSAHAGDWDVAHFHFTWEQHGFERLAAVLAAHHDVDTPVVWTAHDLRNPHTGDAADDAVYLHLLARSADTLLTLTPGASREVAARFSRSARVIPHGPIIDVSAARAWRARRRPRSDQVRLCIHAKALRANLDWRSAIEAVARLAAEDVPVHLDVLVHEEGPGPELVRAALAEVDTDAVTLCPHRPLSLSALCAVLVDHDALVLPYRWGTHSGLIELAADLGVPVVAADVGHLREQHPAVVHRPGADGLAVALRRLVADGPGAPVPLAQRAADLRAFIDGHRAAYAFDGLAGGRGSGSAGRR